MRFFWFTRREIPSKRDKTLFIRAINWLIVSAVLFASCGRDVGHCEDGLCPTATSCNQTTGLCEKNAVASGGSLGLFGRVSWLRMADGQTALLGYSAQRKSLVFVLHPDADAQVSFIAGPAASPDEKAAGESSAAVVAADGQVHVAWFRQSDASLWYAVGGATQWTVTPIPVDGEIGRNVAIGLFQGAAVVAYRSEKTHTMHVAQRGVAKDWDIEEVPPPPPVAGSTVAADVGRSLSLAIGPSGPAISAYDASSGDLILAVRAAAVWSVVRLAGTDAVSGLDTGDVGDPSVLAVGPTGELAVAYRNCTTGQVQLIRSKAGEISTQVVLSGEHIDANSQLSRVDVVGSALDIAVLADGGIAVAVQNGSDLRVVVAVDKAAGGFARFDVPGTAQGWPRLLRQNDGTLAVGYVALSGQGGPSAGRFDHWTLPGGGK